MERLNQFVTRLLIVALIALAAWVGRAWIAKQSLVYHLESWTGAKVNVRQLSLKPDEATVFLSEVEIADPLKDRRNLLQFEAGSLKLEYEQLKNRRVIIEDGRLSQIKFGSPRTNSGRLEQGIFDPARPAHRDVSSIKMVAGKPTVSAESSRIASQRWRDSLVVDIPATSSIETSFQIVPLLKQKTSQWIDRFRGPHLELAQVEESLTMAEKVLSVPFAQRNPLRKGDELANALKAIKDSQKTLEKIGVEITEFESISQKDSYELSQVQLKDRQQLVSGTSVQEFDGKLINEMLVGQLQRELVGSSVEWFQQFRSSLPQPEEDFLPVTRGRDLLFGTTPIPKFEIRELQIDGSTEFVNNHFQFAGTVQNVSSDPANSLEPLKFNLRAQGDPQVVVSGTVDRRQGSDLESIQFTGHAIPQPARVLGTADGIQISMAKDSRLHVEADLRANEFDQFSGTITFSFEDVMLHADSVHAQAGGQGTAARINETVSSLRSFQIRSSLGGTIAQPTCVFVSDLGPQVATSLESVFNETIQLTMKKKEHRLNKTVDGELAALKKNVADGLAKLNEARRSHYQRLGRLQKQLQTARGPEFDRPSNQLR